MKFLWLLQLMLTLLLQTASAQETVGFSDSDRVEPLLEYRLPDWGYSQIFWDFNLTGNRQSGDDGDNRSLRQQYNGRLAPTYFRFHESEERSGTFTATPRIDINTGSIESDINNMENRDRRVALGFVTDLTEIHYRHGSDLFFRYNVRGSFQQRDHREERFGIGETDTDRRIFSRSFNPRAEIGVGYGRLRNVTPMIRALRLDERLQTLDPGLSLNSTDLIAASEQFARQRGYSEIYDRPEKYFWEEMDGQISTNLSAMNAFDLLYLTDTSVELTGQRQEGWSAGLFAGLNYQVQLNRTEDRLNDTENSDVHSTTYVEPRAELQWSRNLSLEHQVSFRSEYQYSQPITGSSRSSHQNLNLSASWLYSITDRLLTNTMAGYSRTNFSSATLNRISAAAEVNYFIENRLSIFTNLQYARSEFAGAEDNRVNFGAGVRYFMSRSLF